MAVRLVVTFHAASGKGTELAQAMRARCEISRQDAGCEQFEVFQSVSDPDKLVLLELWKDQAALDAHAKLQAQRPPLPDAAWNVTTSRTAMAFPPVPEAVSTSIMTHPPPRQACPRNGEDAHCAAFRVAPKPGHRSGDDCIPARSGSRCPSSSATRRSASQLLW